MEKKITEIKSSPPREKDTNQLQLYMYAAKKLGAKISLVKIPKEKTK